MTEPLHIISLGAGVQSSTIALMAAEGLIHPMPAFAVFADTGDEPKEVYEWLEKLREMLPFRVKIAHRGPLEGKLSDNLVEYDHSQIPSFKINPDTGMPGLGKRQCTKHWKIVPVHKKIRECTGTQRRQLPRGFVKLWQGISVDEVTRAKLSREAWIENRFPLLEQRMRRIDCLIWLDKRGLIVPKSACIFCPFRTDHQWRESLNKPEERDVILRVDRQLNARGEFLHPTCQPIDQVDFTTSEQRGQMNLWTNECEGMCGV